MATHLSAEQLAFRSSLADPRFSYCSYVPPDASRLIVVVHGSERSAMAYRDAMIDFAEARNCAILAPLFPVGPFGDDYGDGYKYLAERGLRYDLLLLAMIAEFEQAIGQHFGKFGLFGFSGGGHFVHRFFYLHAEKLWAVSIGAPGAVTLLDPSRDWWLGIRDAGALFGREPDLDAMRAVPVQLIIGGKDTRPLGHNPASPTYRADASLLGDNRMARMDALKRSLEGAGLAVDHVVVPGIGHNGLAMIGQVQDFFARVMLED